jgi:hypothetical protein
MNAIADCSDSEVDLLTCITDILGEFPCISDSADTTSPTWVSFSKWICLPASPTYSYWVSTYCINGGSADPHHGYIIGRCELPLEDLLKYVIELEFSTCKF